MLVVVSRVVGIAMILVGLGLGLMVIGFASMTVPPPPPGAGPGPTPWDFLGQANFWREFGMALTFVIFGGLLLFSPEHPVSSKVARPPRDDLE